jgi:DNA-binding NarL/FixJ family response regulator
MDIRLPGVDGLEASRQIRSEHDGTTVFLLSTYDKEEFASRISGSGAAAFISKLAFNSNSLANTWAESVRRVDSSQIEIQEEKQ